VKPGHGKIIGRIKRLDLAARHGLVDRALERPARRDYQPVTINKSISLTGVPGAGIDTQGETGISGGGFNGTINLANLIIRNVSGSGTSGIGSGGLSSCIARSRDILLGFLWPVRNSSSPTQS
jgi:hypothetical protein